MCSCGSSSKIGQRKDLTYGWLPTGAVTIPNANRSITIKPPSGLIYVGIDDNGNYALVDEGTPTTISCTCTGESGGSCNPFSAPPNYGCITSGCEECGMKTTATVANVDTTLVRGGFLDLSVTPVILNTTSDPIPAAFDAMLYNQDVQNIISDFLATLYVNKPIPTPTYVDNNCAVAPDGHSFAMVNICGRATLLIVPNTALAKGDYAGDSASCKCTAGDCSLATSGNVTYCAGTCTGTCTLTTGSIRNNSFGSVGGYEFQAITYLF